MSLHAAVHMHDDTVIEHHPSQRLAAQGWVRILPMPTVPTLASILYGSAVDFRRLAAACLDMADELEHSYGSTR